MIDTAGLRARRFPCWPVSGGLYNTPSLVYGNNYNTLIDRGFLTYQDAKTGAEIYGKLRYPPDSGAFTANPWAYNGKAFRLSENDSFVIEVGPAFRVFGREPCWRKFTMAAPLSLTATSSFARQHRSTASA